MMTPTVFTRVWGSRSWKYSQAFGMSGTHARFILWQFSERKRKLVAAKNDHPLRGDGSRTPLKKIALGDIEQLQLKEQGLTVDSIPAKDQLVQLRANSNISTGGDSIDMTDEMHASYKEIALGISKAMGAAVCGVDLIIPDLKKPAEPSLRSWGVIEANFNPMMMMHIFPFSGQSRRLTMNVIKMLFPELP